MDTKRRSDRRKGREERSRVREHAGSTGARDVVPGWTTAGVALGAAGVATAVLGLWLIARGDITAAPLLLVLAYVVIFPLALTR